MSGVDLLLDAGDIVGESAVWDERRRALYWVDIGGTRIHSLRLEGGEHAIFVPPERPTSIGLAADGGFVVGLMKDIVMWDGAATYRSLAAIEPDLPGNRLNEGQVAPDGSYWVGTMENNLEADGSPRPIAGAHGRLWRVDPQGRVSALCDDRFGITNTMAWLPGGDFVTADTLQNRLFCYDFHAGLLEDRQDFGAPFPRGVPDGSCVDADGFIWNCRVAGGGCLVRLSPDGVVDRVVELPCSSPTSCTFGGPDLKTLFVTSARFGLSPEHLAAHPAEGGLFALRPGVTGLAARRFG